MIKPNLYLILRCLSVNVHRLLEKINNLIISQPMVSILIIYLLPGLMVEDCTCLPYVVRHEVIQPD